MRPTTLERMHPDDRSLLDILSRRSDLSRPREQAHFFFLPSQSAAESLANAAAQHGWQQAEPPRQHGDDALGWALTLRRDDQPTNAETIPATRELLSDLAAGVGGYYDGWQAATDVGLDRPSDGQAMPLEELDAEDRRHIAELVPLLEKLGVLRTPEAFAQFAAAGRIEWQKRAAADPASVDDVVHLLGTAAGEQIARATGLRWVLLVEGEHEEIVLADAERGVIRPYSEALQWWRDDESADLADFVRAAIVLIQQED